MIKHSEPFSGDMTYSVRLKVETSNAKGCGILLHMQNSLECYMFLITANNQYTFGKYKTVGTQLEFVTLAENFNSFITDSYNTLKISKSGNDMYLFVNNAFIEKITDSDFKEGDVGLFLGGGEKVSFDHALVTDEVEIGKAKTWFYDPFTDTDLNGWKQLAGSGTVKSEDGVLKVAPDSTAVYLYTNGSYKDMPCTTVVTYKSGNKPAQYGIIFLYIKPRENVITYCYLINSSRQFSVFKIGDTYSPVANSNIHGTTDTLIVTKDYELIVNGFMLDDTTLSQGPNFNAAGIYVEKGVSVEFDEFRVGVWDGSAIKQQPNKGIFANARPSYILGGTGIIYDIRGRKVATFQEGYKNKLKSLGAGPYFIVIPNGGKNHIIRRAVINTQ